jgi:hypothetical protein
VRSFAFAVVFALLILLPSSCSKESVRNKCAEIFNQPGGSVKLCSGRGDAPDGSPTEWTAWSVRTAPWDTFQSFRKQTESCNYGYVFKPPALDLSDNENRRLSIYEPNDPNLPKCASSDAGGHPADAKSIVVSTTALRPKRPR